MNHRLIRFALFSLAFCATIQLTGQTLADANTGSSRPDTEYAPAGGSSTSTAALAKAVTVTREFSSTDDAATIAIRKGTVSYQVYTRKSPEMPWKLIETRSGLRDGSDAEVSISQPDSYMLKIMLTAECDECAEVTFRQ